MGCDNWQAVAQSGWPTDGINSIVYNLDGTRIATAARDGTAKIWDAKTGKELQTLSGHKYAVLGVAFSPDGSRIATASEDWTAKVWDAETGKLLFTFDHTDEATSVVFSPDGKIIATAGASRTAILWDVLTGKELLTLRAPDGLTSVAFSPDGSHLAVASRDGTDRIYLLKIEDLMALAKQRVTRSLTVDECQQYLHAATCSGP